MTLGLGVRNYAGTLFRPPVESTASKAAAKGDD
jgi:hypothetical protein